MTTLHEDEALNGSHLPKLRRLTFSIAYRMLGSVADAEDVVQESFLRFHRAQAEGTAIESAKAYLASIATRLAIDHLRSARARREQYVGTWLPEPLVEERKPEAERRLENAESLSMAFLLMMETLSPVERAVFVLREVFDYQYEDISTIVEKTEDNCRQIFVRANQRMAARKPRFESSRERRDELARRFLAACEGGDLAGLEQLLASDATFYGDGGGKVAVAVRQPVHGSDRVARLLHGIIFKRRHLGGRLRPVYVNGQPGAMAVDSQDRLIYVFALDIADEAVQAIRSVINPDKLQHLAPLSDWAVGPQGPSLQQAL
jgi:RNA polymerase sigma-70 factor (ECF subfamily)